MSAAMPRELDHTWNHLGSPVARFGGPSRPQAHAPRPRALVGPAERQSVCRVGASA
jgi:hypothetical protein